MKHIMKHVSQVLYVFICLSFKALSLEDSRFFQNWKISPFRELKREPLETVIRTGHFVEDEHYQSNCRSNWTCISSQARHFFRGLCIEGAGGRGSFATAKKSARSW